MVKYYIVPFGASGDRTSIPNDTQPDGAVNYTDGYGADYSLPLDTDPDARVIERDEFNDLMYTITQNIQQYQQHGIPEFITSSDNGGSPYEYSIGAIVRYNNGSSTLNYVSLTNFNTALPTDTMYWVVFDGVNITGNAATATLASSVTVANEATDTTCYIV